MVRLIFYLYGLILNSYLNEKEKGKNESAGKTGSRVNQLV